MSEKRIKVNVLGEHTPLKSAEPGRVFVVVSNNEPWCDLVLEVVDADVAWAASELAERGKLVGDG